MNVLPVLAIAASIAAGACSAAELRKVTVNGAELSYLAQGSGETVVLVHGLGSDLRAWDSLLPYIADKYRVIAYSRRHHAPNAWPDTGETHNIPQHIEDLAQFIRTLDVGKVHVVGASLGGRIAGHMAVKYPDLVQSLTLSDTLLVVPTDEAAKQKAQPFWNRFQPFAAAVKAGNSSEAVAAMVDWVSGRPDAWRDLAPSRKAYYVENGTALLLAFNGPPAPRTSCDDLGALPVPVLVISGEATPVAFDLSNDRIAECVGHGTSYSRVKGAGHFWYADNPSAAADVIKSFLFRHPIR
jgi:pimeloyl-ACP methyl ester carboxylesterase